MVRIIAEWLVESPGQQDAGSSAGLLPRGRDTGNPQRKENSRSASERVSPRSVFRAWTALVLAIVAATGCGTDAVGTAECRTLERARCQAAAACGYPNVDECIRYQRDHCLHGGVVETPSGVSVDACAEDLARAGRCAAGQGPDTRASSCSEPVLTAPATATACDVVRSPERAASCAFLVPSAAAQPPAPAAAPMVSDGGA